MKNVTMLISFYCQFVKKGMKKREDFVDFQMTKGAHVKLRGQRMVVPECSFCWFDDSEGKGMGRGMTLQLPDHLYGLDMPNAQKLCGERVCRIKTKIFQWNISCGIIYLHRRTHLKNLLKQINFGLAWI